MFSVITNIYNKKTNGPTLKELFTNTRKLKKVFWQLEIFDVLAPHTRLNILTRVWQGFEYRIDVCRVTRGAHIEHL